MMYADVVMEKAEGIEPADGKGIRKILDDMLDEFKHNKGYKSDTEITANELKQLAEEFKAKVKEVLGTEFPDDARAQMEGGIKAVFKSWNGKKAISYRRIEGIPDDWGTSPVTQLPATTSSTANGLSTLRAKTWLQVSAPRTH